MSRQNRHHRHRVTRLKPQLPRLAAELAFLTVARGVVQELLPGGMVVLQRSGRIVAFLDTGDESTARHILGLPPQAQLDPVTGALWELDRRHYTDAEERHAS